MRYNDNEENDLMGDINDLLSSEETPKVEMEVTAEIVEEEAVLIPLDYHIFTTSNGESTGKREPVDTYKCDRLRGIVPINKAKMKADLMKNAFKNKNFFVVETSSKILPSGKVVTVENIVYQTK